MSQGRFVIALVAVVVGLAGFWYLVPRAPSFGMFAVEGEINLTRAGLSFAATIAGVILGSFYRQLRALQATGQTTIEAPLRFIAAMFRSVDMWLGLAGAPIVYALLLQSTSGMTLPGLLVVALENGFCCLVIVNGFVGRVEAKERGPKKTGAVAKAGAKPGGH